MTLAASFLLSGCSQGIKAVIAVTESLESPTRYTLATTEIHCDTEPGAICDEIEVRATVSGSSASTPLVEEKPAAGGVRALTLNKLPERQPDGSFLLRMQFNPDLPPGNYAGEIEVRPFVMDQLSDNPVSRLSYKLAIAPLAGSQPALKPLTGASAWTTHAGNAAHNALLDLTLDPARFSRRWTIQAVRGAEVSAPVVARGLVYVARNDSPRLAQVQAIDEADGRIRWSTSVEDTRLSGPAVDDGRLLVQADFGRLLSLDAGTGIKQYETTGLRPSEWLDLAPTLQAGAVYFATDRQIASADAVTTVARWTTDLGLAIDQTTRGWTPTIGNGMALVASRGHLVGYRLADGMEALRVPLAGETNGDFTWQLGAPVLVDASTVAVLNRRYKDVRGCGANHNTLSIVDTVRASVRWSADGCFSTNPVVGNGVVYIGNAFNNRIEVRALADGQLLWHWTLGDLADKRLGGNHWFCGDLVLTRNLLFVASDRVTYAVDISTRKTVWRHNMGGSLAISDQGLLHIVQPRSLHAAPWMTAINLH